MSVQTVTITNPDGTTTDVTMVCVQDQNGNVVRDASGRVDARHCNFGPVSPPVRIGPLSVADFAALSLILVLATFLLF